MGSTMGAYLHYVGLIKPVGVSQVLHACKVCVGINEVFNASGWAWHCRLMRICFTRGGHDVQLGRGDRWACPLSSVTFEPCQVPRWA